MTQSNVASSTRILFLYLSVFSVLLVSCSSTNEVPNDIEREFSGRIVANRYDESLPIPLVAQLLDSNGQLIRALDMLYVGSTAKDAILGFAFDTVDRQLAIVVTNSEGQNPHKIRNVTGPGLSFDIEDYKLGDHLVMSANGSHVAYISRDSVAPFQDKKVLHVMRSDGTNAREIPDFGSARAVGVALSPDGSKVAYLGDSVDGRSSLKVARTDGSGSTTLLTNIQPIKDFPTMIAWSPDGTRLVFNDASPVASVRVINADGSGLVTIAEGGYPAWSPDGKSIAFTRIVRDASARVEIAHTSDMGVTITNLTNGPGFKQQSHFSPDGKKILYSTFEDSEYKAKLMVTDIATKETKSLVNVIYYTGYWIQDK